MIHRSLAVIITLIIVFPFCANGQKKDSVVYGWKHSLVAQLTLTQAAYTDWVAGGANSLAYTMGADGADVLDREKDNWSTAYKFAFGQARLGDQGLRKTDDQIKFESIYTYKIGTVVNPYASVTMNTQFATGYNYSADGTSKAVSTFFDPAYLSEGVGFGYQPITEVKTRLGLAVREIITSTYNSYASDPGSTTINKVKVDGGIQFGAEVNWPIDDRTLFTSKLDLFDAFKALDVVIVHWDNMLAAKVNKIISVTATSQVINERAVSPRTQIRESIGLSISLALL